MGFLSPIGLLALLGVPAVLALHLFRRRFSEHPVAGLFLFAPDEVTAMAGRQRNRLRRTASFILELLAALLLALWLGGFSLGAKARIDHLVMVLDDSASLGAQKDGESAADRVRQQVAHIIDNAEDQAQVTLVLTGSRPRILAGPRAAGKTAVVALDGWEPQARYHHFGPALDLGEELAGEGGQLFFFSDRNDLAVPSRYRYLAWGKVLPNAAIVGGNRRHAGVQEKIALDFLSFGLLPGPLKFRISAIRADGGEKVLTTDSISLTPGQVGHRVIGLPPSRLAIKVTLAPDALALDNELILLHRPRRIVKVANLIGPEMTQSLDLAAVLEALPGIKQVPASGANLVFREESAPLAAFRTQLLLSRPEKKGDAWLGPFLKEVRHPLLTGVTLDGVVWTSGKMELTGLPLVTAGNQILIALEEPLRGRRLHLNLDPERSNFCTSPDWPILISNLVELVRQRLPGPERVNLQVGDGIVYRQGGEFQAQSQVVLTDPTGRGHRTLGTSLLSWEGSEPGLYQLHAGDQLLARYAVHFVDQGESDLTVCGNCDRARAKQVQSRGDKNFQATGVLEGRLLALLLLLAIVGDWWVLRRGNGGGQQ